FFQAEDGIRDRTVTGVQTCALPICQQHGWVSHAAHAATCAPSHVAAAGPGTLPGASPAPPAPQLTAPGPVRPRDRTVADPVSARSEERRVGKEGSCEVLVGCCIRKE